MTRRAFVVASVAVLVAVLVGCGGTEVVDVERSWWLEAEPDGASLVVRAEVGSSSCDTFDHLEVTESDTTVAIQAHVRSEQGGECTADLGFHTEEVVLDAPLGDRDLIGCDPADAARDCREVQPFPAP
ncbi:hypothetical protein FTX61_16470 [Nitriliruptoraceae bacterium ZYF776]|nr:hypothetical protein [Profundirhabdus halotolerans]